MFQTQTNPTSFHIRPLRPSDAPQVAKIWVSGLRQTADSRDWGVSRWIWGRLMDRLAVAATAADGDVGIDGGNLWGKWG